MVYVTQGTFLYMLKDVKVVNEEENAWVTRQDALCLVQPKNFVGSGNAVWDCHLVDNRHHEPALHEAERGDIPLDIHSALLKLKDTLKSFNMHTVKNDALLVSKGRDFIEYEQQETFEYVY